MAGGIITTGSFSLDLEPIGMKSFMDAEKSLDPIYKRLFKEEFTKRAYEHEAIFGGLGLATMKPQGSSISYDSMAQGPEKIYHQATYANGFIITEDMADFGQTGILMKNGSSELRKSLMEAKEEILADVIDNAFTNTYVGADGKELCALDHPIQDGNTIANEVATPGDISETILEQMLIEQKENMKDYRGKRVSIPTKFLVIPRELVFEAQRILKSVNRVDSANNDVNAIRSLGFLSEDVLCHDRLDDADSFFLKCDVQNGLKVYQSKAPTFRSDNDFDTLNLKFTAHERYGYGWSDYRCLFGCPGV